MTMLNQVGWDQHFVGTYSFLSGPFLKMEAVCFPCLPNRASFTRFAVLTVVNAVTFFWDLTSRGWEDRHESLGGMCWAPCYLGSSETLIVIIIIIIIIIGIQPLGRSEQRPEFSQATGMALVRCILGKLLGVACHCFPPLFRRSHFSPPGASTSATT